jgi:hypothetical protein
MANQAAMYSFLCPLCKTVSSTPLTAEQLEQNVAMLIACGGCRTTASRKPSEGFDWGWIKAQIESLNDPNLLWAERRRNLESEIAIRESDLKAMATTMPNDSGAHACLAAYLFALKKTLEEVNAEPLKRR